MVANRTSGTRKWKRLPLWPLVYLPFAGFLAGYYIPTQNFRQAHFGGFRLMPLVVPEGTALAGAFLGCCLMMIVGSAVLTYRLGRSRFTIGAMLFLIAVVAVLLGWVRSIVP
jgi:hypothetical protein